MGKTWFKSRRLFMTLLVVIIVGAGFPLTTWTTQAQLYLEEESDSSGGGGGGDDSDESIIVFPVDSAVFEEAFPDYELYAFVNTTRLSPKSHTVARNPSTGSIFNITAEFNDLLSDADVTIDDSSDAILYGSAFAEIGNLNIQGSRSVVNSTDSNQLGVVVDDPEAWQDGTSWVVTLETWTQENGVLAEWRLEFALSQLAEAKWSVSHNALGDHDKRVKATNLRINDTVTNTYGLAGHSIDAERETDGGRVQLILPGDVEGLDWSTFNTSSNFDNSSWEIQYPSDRSVPQEISSWADAVSSAGASVYGTQVESNPNCGNVNPSDNWGFTSLTPDCTLELRVLPSDALYCAVCVAAGNDTVMYVDQNLTQWLGAQGVYTNDSNHDQEAIAESVVAELHFHNLQYAIGQWDPFWPTLFAGQARLAAALTNPATETHPSSLWTHAVNGYQENPGRGPCLEGVGSASYWGLMYAENSGLPFLRKSIEALAEESIANGTDCRKDIQATVNSTLTSLRAGNYTTNHQNQTEATVDFGTHAYTRNFTWAPPHSNRTRDWGAHAQPVERTATSLNEVAEPTVRAWATEYLEFPGSGVYTVSISCGGGDDWRFLLLTTTDDDHYAWGELGCGDSWNVSARNKSDVTLASLRVGVTPDNHTATAKPFPTRVRVETDVESMKVNTTSDFTTTVGEDNLTTTFHHVPGPVHVSIDSGSVCTSAYGDLVGCIDTSDGAYTAFSGPHVTVLPEIPKPTSECAAQTVWEFAWGEARDPQQWDVVRPDPNLVLNTTYVTSIQGQPDTVRWKAEEEFTTLNPTVGRGDHLWEFTSDLRYYEITYKLFDNRTEPRDLLDETTLQLDRSFISTC